MTWLAPPSPLAPLSAQRVPARAGSFDAPEQTSAPVPVCKQQAYSLVDLLFSHDILPDGWVAVVLDTIAISIRALTAACCCKAMDNPDPNGMAGVIFFAARWPSFILPRGVVYCGRPGTREAGRK